MVLVFVSYQCRVNMGELLCRIQPCIPTVLFQQLMHLERRAWNDSTGFPRTIPFQGPLGVGTSFTEDGFQTPPTHNEANPCSVSREPW